MLIKNKLYYQTFNNNNNNDIIIISKSQRSRSPDPYKSSSKRRWLKKDRRCHTLPSKFYYRSNVNNNHPYFSQHTHHLCSSNYIMGDPIDTTSLNNGVMFYQNPVNGE